MKLSRMIMLKNIFQKLSDPLRWLSFQLTVYTSYITYCVSYQSEIMFLTILHNLGGKDIFQFSTVRPRTALQLCAIRSDMIKTKHHCPTGREIQDVVTYGHRTCCGGFGQHFVTAGYRARLVVKSHVHTDSTPRPRLRAKFGLLIRWFQSTGMLG